jgi:hypothetical protein
MALQFDLSGSQVFSVVPGESFSLLSLTARRVYRSHNHTRLGCTTRSYSSLAGGGEIHRRGSE